MSLIFLHTAEVHINTFETLVSETDSSVQVKHHVNPQLLDDARNFGADNPKVIEAVQAEVAQLVQNGANLDGANLVVCTCSTIGGIVESLSSNGLHDSVHFQRIDRAMADTAVLANKDGRTKIVIVAALKSTLEPTQVLIESSAIALNKEIDLSLHHTTDAWQYFEANDQQSYWKTIAHHIAQCAKTQPDVIVLAQASMANAVNYCNDIKTPILSSPSLGVEAALKTIKQI